MTGQPQNRTVYDSVLAEFVLACIITANLRCPILPNETYGYLVRLQCIILLLMPRLSLYRTLRWVRNVCHLSIIGRQCQIIISAAMLHSLRAAAVLAAVLPERRELVLEAIAAITRYPRDFPCTSIYPPLRRNFRAVQVNLLTIHVSKDVMYVKSSGHVDVVFHMYSASMSRRTLLYSVMSCPSDWDIRQ